MSAEPSPTGSLGWRSRPMRAADLDAVCDIERDIYPFPWTAGNFSDSLKASYDAWVFETAEARTAPRIVGYAIVMWIPDEIHLLNLSVAAHFQSRGFGRAILEWICADGSRRGARAMMLEVRPSNARARALYDSMGFERIGTRRRYYPAEGGTREDALVLHKVLVDE